MPAQEVNLTWRDATPTFVVAAATTWPQFPGLWGQLLDEVYRVIRADPSVAQASLARAAAAAAARAGADTGTDAPRERWRNVMLYRDDVPNVEVGVLATEPVSARDRVVHSSLPAGMVAHSIHRGPYALLGDTHRAVVEWCTAHGHLRAGPRWEIYGHWREDPQALETEVCYLVAPQP